MWELISSKKVVNNWVLWARAVAPDRSLFPGRLFIMAGMVWYGWYLSWLVSTFLGGAGRYIWGRWRWWIYLAGQADIFGGGGGRPLEADACTTAPTVLLPLLGHQTAQLCKWPSLAWRCRKGKWKCGFKKRRKLGLVTKYKSKHFIFATKYIYI